ncbi:hypothetical protein SETIT_6G077200v2 [Setaria italica]|uniref:Uncharacterized protein n=1 Tax=Setaria italica TaxID=4555 RepID=A0A368RJ57_SETIT|nr:hypothetical protein SETIT_6G077200v2 [Setaria italica]
MLLAPPASIYQLAPHAHDFASDKWPLPLPSHGFTTDRRLPAPLGAAATAPVNPLGSPLPHRLPCRIQAPALPQSSLILVSWAMDSSCRLPTAGSSLPLVPRPGSRMLHRQPWAHTRANSLVEEEVTVASSGLQLRSIEIERIT